MLNKLEKLDLEEDFVEKHEKRTFNEEEETKMEQGRLIKLTYSFKQLIRI